MYIEHGARLWALSETSEGPQVTVVVGTRACEAVPTLEFLFQRG